MPASLAKDIALYALERECSVSDLLNSILRRAIPSLKVVSVTSKKGPIGVTGDTAADAEGGAAVLLHDDDAGDDAGEQRAAA